MLRLDAGRLYDKYVGATEQNLHKALETAERLAPVVLWVDEIEKALASGGDSDGGVSQRVLGTFLTWLQEKRGSVFVVATANNIARLPAELLRKGRFTTKSSSSICRAPKFAKRSWRSTWRNEVEIRSTSICPAWPRWQTASVAASSRKR